MSKELKPYPNWVCRDCGLKAMRKITLNLKGMRNSL